MEHPHALHYGGFGESSTDKTLPKTKKKSKKKEKEKEKSLKRKSQASEKRKSKDMGKKSPTANGSVAPVVNGTLGETKLDSNFNSVDPEHAYVNVDGTPRHKPTSDTISSKPDVGYITYENEITLDEGKVAYTKPRRKKSDTQSLDTVPSRDSIGKWSSSETLNKSTGPLINDDLVSAENVDLFTYDNPGLLSSQEDMTQSNASLQSEGVIDPPKQFQDSLPNVDPPHTYPLDTPHIVLEPNVAIVRPSVEDLPPRDTESDEEERPVSVKQRASMFEHSPPAALAQVHNPRRHSIQRSPEQDTTTNPPLANGSGPPRYVIARSDIDLKPSEPVAKPGGGASQAQSFLWSHINNKPKPSAKVSPRVPTERTVL